MSNNLTLAEFSKLRTTITEGFSTQDIPMAIKRIANVISRKCGQTFYPHAGADIYHNSKRNKNTGWRFYVGNSYKAIRFNVEDGQSGSSSISSIDFWDNSPTGKAPTARIDTAGYNVVQLVDSIVIILEDPRAAVGHTISAPLSESTITEAAIVVNGVTYPTKQDAVGAALAAGHTPAQIVDAGLAGHISQVYTIKAKIKTGWVPKAFNAAGGSASGEPELDEEGNEIPVVPGFSEISIDPDVISGNKMLAQKQYANPDEVFEDLAELVRLVISGDQASLLVAGDPGVGKTYDVTKTIKQSLGEAGDRWQHIKGKTTPFGLVQTLFENHDQLIVFDDCDSALQHPECVMVLKGALDSYDKREISWLNRSSFPSAGLSYDDMYSTYMEEDRQKLPRKFEFEGQVIFISNLGLDQIDDAIKSRTLCIDIALKATDVILRIKSILKDLAPGVSMDHKLAALEILEKRVAADQSRIDLRTMIMAAKIKAGGSPIADRLIAKYA